MLKTKKVILECYQDGLRQMVLELKFKTPLEIPVNIKKSKEFIQTKLRSWCAGTYDYVVVKYKDQYKVDEVALIFTKEEQQ